MADSSINLLMSEMYTSHHAWLQKWLSRRLASHEVAADLVQDTFVSVLNHAPEKVTVIQEPRAYLVTIAKRILSNHYQRKSLEEAYLDALRDLPEAHAISPEEKLILLQTLHEIDRMLGTLPPKVRQAFLLLHLEHCKYAEIALRLNVSERTVKRYIAEAFEQCLHYML